MWEISSYNQLISVACSVVCGGVLCAVYDVLRAARRVRRYSFLAVFISDILFCCFSSLAVFFLLLARTYGEVRGYIFFAVALGFLLFRISLSKLTYKVFCFLLKILSKAVNFLSKTNKKVCLFAVGGLSFAAGKITGFFLLFKKLLKKPQKVLYNKEKSEKAGENTDGS